MGIPQILVHAESMSDDAEIAYLKESLETAITKFGISGLVHGGISSDYQRKKFEKLGEETNLKILCPLWHAPPKQYMHQLLDAKFRFVITSVAADGLDDSWLGKEITYDDLNKLESLSKRYGFNLNFEGGEAETFVTNSPMFSSPILINKGRKIWDGYRGRFEIEEAELQTIA